MSPDDLAITIPGTPLDEFKFETGNHLFQTSGMTWVSLFFLLIAYPAISLIGVVGDDPLAMLRDLSSGMLIVLLLSTIIFQWVIFLLNFVTVYKERTGLQGVGLTRLRLIHVLWAVAFLLASNLILAGLAWVMGQIGLPLSGDVGLLVPKDTFGRFLWVGVSLTAGFCEEIAFRGYLMTRLRLIGKVNSWVIPTIISAIVFGLCHAYQGIPGFIIITIYGAMFSLLYIRTRSLWPCIIAHFLQDFGGLFWPH